MTPLGRLHELHLLNPAVPGVLDVVRFPHRPELVVDNAGDLVVRRVWRVVQGWPEVYGIVYERDGERRKHFFGDNHESRAVRQEGLPRLAGRGQCRIFGGAFRWEAASGQLVG